MRKIIYRKITNFFERIFFKTFWTGLDLAQQFWFGPVLPGLVNCKGQGWRRRKGGGREVDLRFLVVLLVALWWAACSVVILSFSVFSFCLFFSGFHFFCFSLASVSFTFTFMSFFAFFFVLFFSFLCFLYFSIVYLLSVFKSSVLKQIVHL